MALIMQIIFVAFLSIGTLIALRKDYHKLTDEQKKQPILLILESFSTIGLILLIIGIVILENLLLENIAITLFIIGIVFNVMRYSKSDSALRNVKAFGLGLFVLVFFIFYLSLRGALL